MTAGRGMKAEELRTLAEKLRVTTAQMARRASVDMVLWGMHAGACHEAAAALDAVSHQNPGAMRSAAEPAHTPEE